jgi:serine protease Do
MARRRRLLSWFIAGALGAAIAGQSGWSQDDVVAVQPAAEQTEIKTSAPLEEILSGVSLPKTVDDLRAMQEHVSSLAERVKQATVGIECQGAQGSGVIVSRDGLILTAAHVIGQPGLDATVTLSSGRRLKAKTKGVNHRIDSGMLKIVEPGESDWSYLDLGESNELRQGQWVIAIGHPGGYQEQRGTVVRIGRLLNVASQVLRTDCTLVGGDSGGPLVNMDGEVVGIHSRIGALLTQNLHVPVDAYSIEWDKLEADEEIGGSGARVWLGFELKSGTLEVESVTEDGPAAKAGMKAGDVIVRLNGTTVNDRDQLWEETQKMNVGQTATLVVQRDSSEVELKIQTERRR